MPIAVEHARRRRVDVGRDRGLHAAGEREHLSRVARRGPRARRRNRDRHFLGERRRQERAREAAEPQEAAEQRDRCGTIMRARGA